MKKLYTLALAALLAGTAQAQNVTQADFIGEIVPQYMASGTGTRLPVIYKARLQNLTPNATYQFRTTLGIGTDLGTTNNTAGNPLLLNNPNAIRYTTSQSLQPNRSGSFTTDGTGAYTGWFGTVNTGNSRFTAGNDVIPVITLNGGTGAAGDTTAQKRMALDVTVKVLAFGSAGTEGTGIWGASQAAPKNFVALYDNEAGTGRPLNVTVTQSIGLTIASIAPFYASNVEGVSGAWGTIIPNNLANGVRRIALYDNTTGGELANNTSANGTWGSTNTVNPSGGSATPLAISATAAPLITSILQPKAKTLVAVSPNPAVNVLTVEGLMPNETIEVQDMMGRKQAIQATQGRVDVRRLHTGHYLIVTSQGKMARFVKVD